MSDPIPGVEFDLEEANVEKSNGKYVAEVVLTAHINDLDMFDQVQDKLDGLKIYTAEDFQTQINNLLREDKDKLEVLVQELNTEVSNLEESVAQQASFFQEREKELRKENEILKERISQLEALERELQDLAVS